MSREWGVGNGEWGEEEQGEQGKQEWNNQCPMPNSQFPIPS
ncbi:hypothetical protein [Nostoc favosum]|nr:hypothetical protein [Nostoc favosum]